MRPLRPALTVTASLLFSGAFTAGSAQQPLPLKHTGKPTVPAITAADAMTRLYVFADDSMMGREAGSEGDRRGTRYIESEVRRLGLVPAGENGTFFQAVPMFTRALDVAGSNLTADGTELVAARDYFPIHTGGRHRPVDGAQVVFAGSATDPAAMLAGDQAAGKVVLFTGPIGGIARRYPGAIAFLIPRPDAQMAQIRDFVLSTPTLVRSDADTVLRDLAIYVPLSAVQKFLGVPIVNARPGTLGRTLRGRIEYRVTELPARNVVAAIPGSDPVLKGQYVAFGAHSDHLGTRQEGPVDHDSLRAFNRAAAKIVVAKTGALPELPGTGITREERATIRLNLDSMRRARPARLDSIYNGADDDGSGTVGLLEIAERFASAKVKPRRSLLFVWHTAEEEGLFGSAYFTDHPTVSRDSIVAQLNIDMIGRGGAEDTPGGGPDYVQLLGSRRLSTEFGNLIEEVNGSPSNSLKLDYSYDANGHPEQYYCRSDHYQYARYGIPVVFMGTGGHPDYHQVTDEPQYIDYAHLARVASFVADVGERVANLDHRVVVDRPKPNPNGRCVQ